MRTRNFNLGLAVALAALLSALTATPSFAAPVFDLQFTNNPTTLPRHEEDMTYVAKVKNVAGESAEVGDQLACSAAGPPVGKPTPTLKYQWIRNGEDIPGATSTAYTVAVADEGKSLQCKLTATNQPEAPGYAPISVVQVSLPPVPIAPIPTPAPPRGIQSADLGGSNVAAVSSGTATTTAGSDVLADVITAEGTGTLTAGSKIVTGVIATTGTFEGGDVTQGVTGTGIPPETYIAKVEAGTLELSNPAEVSGVHTLKAGAGPFGLGQSISGPGIPPGATVIAATNQGSGDYQRKIIMSNTATASASGVSITGASELICEPPSGWSGDGITWSYQWLRSGTPIPGANSAAYTVTKDDTEPFSYLQCEATATDAFGNEAVAVSVSKATRPRLISPFQPPNVFPPTVSVPNSTSGPVTLEVELPSGHEVFIASIGGGGWNCSVQQAVGEANTTATCTNDGVLDPGESYADLTIGARLGKDAPEVGVAKATVSGGGAGASATAEATYTFTPGLSFGLLAGSFEAGVFDEAGDADTRAGAHPYRGYSTFRFNANKNGPIENVKSTVVDAPRGFGGNATASPAFCGAVEEVILGICPSGSAVGGIDVFVLTNYLDVPIYSLEPEFGTPAQFSFVPAGLAPYTFVPELRADEGYAISFRTAPVITQPPLNGATVDLCNFGAKMKGSGGTTTFERCREAGEAGANEIPLFTNPTRCSGPPPTASLRINSWQHPEDVKTYDFVAPQITDCDEVLFEPEATLQPTSTQADSPTGLNVEFTMPTDGLLTSTGISQAYVDNAIVTFPKGMSINSAAADGLGACAPAQVQLKTNAPASCPDSSKVGQIEIDTPLIRETLKGSVFLAAQKDNPFNETIGLYMVFSSARDGVTIKIAGKVESDPETGQLVSTFVENPEAPFSRLALKFNSGPRAPLINPPKCGTYAIKAEFSPWSAVNPANPTSAEVVTDNSTYKVTRGPSNAPCPTGDLEPKLDAGTIAPRAGAKSPFVLSLSREDGSRRFTGVEIANPRGLTAYLKGVGICPESALANVSPAEGAGASEIANPSCPASSLVGVAEAGSGAGPLPFYVKTGRVYLAGPYKGAPISLAVVTPALAGPYDLGSVLVRTAIYIDPETAQVRAVTDPIPLALHGIALNVRDIRVALDRPGFTANPTSCEPSSVGATVKGEGGAIANVSNRFQVGGCEALGFKPKLSFRLFGGTKRGAHPKFRAVLRAREGDANIAAASVALPRSEFLDQDHIRTVCTRVQFAADQCPQGSVYGEAEATTPLLDAPLSGPVYLRSSSHELPDLVVALRGPDSQPIEVALAGRIDSVNGGIRSSFEVVPDQPVSSFTLTMQGGRRGLLVNSRDLCKAEKPARATAVFGAQNGRELELRPKLQNACKKAARKGKGKKSKGSKRR